MKEGSDGLVSKVLLLGKLHELKLFQEAAWLSKRV